MYKVLLVDDERIIREGIASIVDWEEYGFEFIGASKNAIEAFELIKENPPHVVITDIKMPVWDGIELINRVKEEFPEIVFVILSGYGEFDYASRAMRKGVKHYLLKPCNEDKIAEVLKEIKGELLQKEKEDEFIVKFGELFAKENYEKMTDKHSKIIRTLINILLENIANESLNLKWIAEEKMYMNVGYLSRLFKKEMGEKFSQYLLKVRMEKAKELIENSDIDKIYEVAEKVGCGNNPQYFSQLYKKYTGFTPTEYKESLNR